MRSIPASVMAADQNDLNLFGSTSPPLGAYTFAVVFGFDTPLLAAGLFIFYSRIG